MYVCVCVHLTWLESESSSYSADQGLPGFVPLPYSVPVKNLWAFQRPQSIFTSLMEPQADLSGRQFPLIVTVSVGTVQTLDQPVDCDPIYTTENVLLDPDSFIGQTDILVDILLINMLGQ